MPCGAAHGYDLTIPAPSTVKQVCVTAVNVGSGTDITTCQQVDKVMEFDTTGISYDTSNAKIIGSNLVDFDPVEVVNATTVQQPTTISSQKVVTDTQSWTDTEGVKVSVEGTIKIPVLADFKIAVEGSVSFTQNGSDSEAKTWTWQQVVNVPPEQIVKATVTVTDTTLVVPYTMSGSYVYSSGASAPGSVSGTYSGIDGHDLMATLPEYDLDGSPAAHQVQKLGAALVKVS
jgi:hypothetical protein